MTTITLDLPDDLAKQLQKFDIQTLMIELLHQFLHPAEEDSPADAKFKFTILPPNPADDDFVLVPPVEPPEPQYTISREEWKQRLLALSKNRDDTPLEPPKEMFLVPQIPLPEFTPSISKEEWLQKLLTISQWSEEEIREIEKGREYINRWRPKSF